MTKLDHGGNLDAAMQRFGGARADWLDLSTGINPVPYPVPPLPLDAWAALPRRAELNELCEVAQSAYGTSARAILFSGAQGAIQIIPSIRAPGRAAIVCPTYNEHAHALRQASWCVDEARDITEAEGADLAVVVNPNNPDGRVWRPETLRALAERVGILVVDESFADPTPDLSLAGDIPDNTVVLRSFGKFYGLAGLRLGFALVNTSLSERLGTLAGPWPVSGPAIEIGKAALSDAPWRIATSNRLCSDAAKMDRLADAQGWSTIGGTVLFRTYGVADASAVQEKLATARVWSRIFPYAPNWIRLGLPHPDRWEQTEKALAACR